MKVFKFQFYRLPFTYEQEDRFYKEEHVNLYKINWNSDSVNNQISWDFTDPLNPKIRVVGKLVGYKNNVLVEAENDFNYCYVEYGENSSKLMKQYFFTIPIRRLSFNAYEYTLKLDVIMTYWDKFYGKYENTLIDIERATFHHYNRDGSFTYFANMAYSNCEFEDVIYDMNYTYKTFISNNRGNLSVNTEYKSSNTLGRYCIYHVNSQNLNTIINYVDSLIIKRAIKERVENDKSVYIYVGMAGGKISENSSYIVRTTLGYMLEKTNNNDKMGDNYLDVIQYSSGGEPYRKYNPGISSIIFTNESNSGSINIFNFSTGINKWFWHNYNNNYKLDSFVEKLKIENWCFYDGIKREIISIFTPNFWPTKSLNPRIRLDISISSDLITIIPTLGSYTNIYWDLTLPVSYSYPKIEEYIRENRNQLDNARTIGDQNIRLAQWERNTAAAGHAEGIIRGGLSGFGTGALVGSMVPVIGTAIGGVVGTIGGALTGGAISGGFNAYGVGNTKIDIAKLERQSIEEKLSDMKNIQPTIRSNSTDYSNQIKTSSYFIGLRYNNLHNSILDVFANYYSKFGSKYNIFQNLSTIINNKRRFWYFIKTKNLYKYLDDYFPTYIKNELSNVLDNGMRLHHTLDDGKFNLEVFNKEIYY